MSRLKTPLLGGMTMIAAACMPAAAAAVGLDTTQFQANALAAPPETVDCTLESGDTAKCAKLVVNYLPEGLAIGPFCPATLDDVGGLWSWDGDKPGLYRLDRAFFEMLNGLGFKFYDDKGEVHRASPAEGRPTQEHACLQVAPDTTVKMTVLIPLEPRAAEAPSKLGTVAKVGLGLDGVPIFADAPSVKDTGHLPALDTCGGHIDPGGWYHWHANPKDMSAVYGATGVNGACALPQSSSALFGYALDGYPIYGSADEGGVLPADLDECGGHTGPTANNPEPHYHYHTPVAFPNLPKCLKGVVARGNFKTTAKLGIGAQSGLPVGLIAGVAAILAAIGLAIVWFRRRRAGAS
jgi:hypothetical protein